MLQSVSVIRLTGPNAGQTQGRPSRGGEHRVLLKKAEREAQLEEQRHVFVGLEIMNFFIQQMY